VRALPDDMDLDVVAGIDLQLDDVEERDQVQLLWAIESGSRAWGFPSPDSDYDCRFIYAHPVSVYLSPWRPRDVIEMTPGPVFDLNGWDLLKAVRLLVKGNATVGEWLRSPIVYRGNTTFRDEFLDLATQVFDLERTRAHYLHVGRLQWPLDPTNGRLKRAMYALRAATSLRWLREHDSGIPPMDLPSLMQQTDLPLSLEQQMHDLIAVKARTREADLGLVSPDVSHFVQDEFSRAESMLTTAATRPDEAHAREAASLFFQKWTASSA
jgi:hypothetical protein